MRSSAVRTPGLSLRLSRSLVTIVTLVVGIALTWHVGILLLYNSPDNYVKIQLDPVINAYTGKTLFQRWTFFAPNPIAENEYLLVRARTAKGVTTPWINVSRVLINDLQKDRFSPYEFVLTGVSNGVLEMPNRYHGDKLATGKVDLSLLNGFRQLLRTGASILTVQYRDTRFSEIQIAFLTEAIPGFNERARPSSDKPNQINMFLWQPFPNGVDTGVW